MAAQSQSRSMEETELQRTLESEIVRLAPGQLKLVMLTALTKGSNVLNVFKSLLLVSADAVADSSEDDEDDSEGDDEDDDSISSDEEEEQKAMLPYETLMQMEDLFALGGEKTADQVNVTSATLPTQNQNSTQKRTLSPCSDMEVQPKLKKYTSARLVPRYERCENCLKDFDVTQNFREACIYHAGELEVDFESSTWDDWDEDCHGTIDDTLEEDYPEGFVWSCCEEDGTSAGCHTEWHRR